MQRILVSAAIPKNRRVVYHHTMRYVLILMTAPLWAQTMDQLDLRQVAASKVQYEGKDAVRLLPRPNVANGESYAILKGERFHNGTIEASVAGKPGASAAPDARGFIGIAFRLQGNRYEYIYLRPTNGRADDQVRRNHSVTEPTRRTISTACAANHPKNTNRMSICSRASGLSTRS
jgi:hypothetical protein